MNKFLNDPNRKKGASKTNRAAKRSQETSKQNPEHNQKRVSGDEVDREQNWGAMNTAIADGWCSSDKNCELEVSARQISASWVQVVIIICHLSSAGNRVKDCWG